LSPTTQTTTPGTEGLRLNMAAPPTAGSPTASAGTWHPRSNSLTRELPPLLAEMRRRGLHVRRVTYPLTEWDDAARKVQLAGDLVRLGGFRSMPARTVRLTGTGDQAVVLDVVPADEPAPGPAATPN
jgi:hypothetical protein